MNAPYHEQRHEDAEDEINLLEILQFFISHIRTLGLGAFGGLLLAVVGWFGLVQYKAELTLVNQGAISFIDWKSLSKSLPQLADQMIAGGQVNAADSEQYKAMRSPQWWSGNVKPTFSLSKADTKELAAMSKQMTEAGGDRILSFALTAKAGSREQAQANVEVAARFMQQGGSYLEIQSLINGYETRLLTAGSELASRISKVQVELKYQQERVRNLERLRERFPGNTASVSQQVVDVSDANAKFMPISTQLVAVKTDINNNEEQLRRMQDELERLNLIQDFVAKARPMLDTQFNGLLLADQMLAIEKELRERSDREDINQQQALNTLQAELISVRTKYSKGLESRLAPTSVKATGVVPLAAIGLMLGFMLAIAWAVWPLLRNKLKAQPAA